VSKGFISPTEDGLRLDLRVSPGAKRTSIEGPYAEVEHKAVLVRGLGQEKTPTLLSAHLR
jgi:hypothetical protein